MAQPYEPINLLLLLPSPSVAWYGWWYLVHLVLFGWLAYRFLRRIGCAHAAALLGLVAAVLGTWTQAKLHHNVILTAALSLWPMLSATHALVAEGAAGTARRRAVGWLALWTGLSWSSGFVVVSLQASYLTALWALFCAARAPRGERLPRLVPVAAGLALGGVASLANMLPVLLASAESARAGTFDAARLAALGLEWDHALTLAWPDLMSWAADRFYVTEQAGLVHFDTRMPWSQLVLLQDPLRPEDHAAFHSWVETSFAVGVVPLAAAASALFDRRHRAIAWLFAAMALLAFGMATAAEPFFALARVLPGIAAGDLRRLLFTVAMALVVLTGLGADAWLRAAARAPARVALGAIAATSIVALVWLWQHADPHGFVRGFAELFVLDHDHATVVAVGGDPTALAAAAEAAAAPGEVANNRTMLLATAWRALMVAGAGLALSWVRRPRAVVAAAALTAVELLHTGLGPVQTVPAERVTRLPKVLAPLADGAQANGVRPRLGRLVAPGARTDAALPGNIPGFLGVEDSGAYNPLPKAREEEFFRTIDPSCVYGGAGVGSFHEAAALAHPLCDLFGVRFVLTPLALPGAPGLVDRTPPGTGVYRLYERTTVLPRATFVRQVDVIADRDARLRALADPGRDVAHRVVLERDDAPRPAPAAGATAAVQITAHRDERVELTVACSHDGYVRLADPYDAGWTATVDGAAAEVFVADHYLRAVHVPAGEHAVVFRYDGARAVWPLRLSLCGWLGVLVLLLGGRRRQP